MVQRDTLRQKLKAADRRRQRRSVESPQARQPDPAAVPGIDVVGLVVREILDHAESLGQEARDAIVIAALKASLNATTPNGPDARQLLQQLNSLPARTGVSLRALRDATQQLLSQATASQDPRINDAFLKYLGVIAA